MELYKDAKSIMDAALEAAMPESSVLRALEGMDFGGRRLHLAAIGKAAWRMAKCAYESCPVPIADGVVITKYGHSQGAIGKLRIFEAGHPISDENSYRASSELIALGESLGPEDALLFLVSGGGSALFEKPLVPAQEYEDINAQLLACGADIVEINTVRKRLSAVKGGKFAQLCAPGRVYAVLLSDVLGDRPDAIASGPVSPDPSNSREALDIAKKYRLKLSPAAMELLAKETPKELGNVETHISGSVRELCRAAEKRCEELGYEPIFLTDRLCCQAREAGSFLGSVAASHAGGKPAAYIAGGETVVKLTGKGLGGRNQELALAAAEGLAGLENAALFSLGSDGTDGPTDAAGGYVDGSTKEALSRQGIKIAQVLENNDSYTALKKVGGLIITGPTGTNVNDLTVLLLR